MHAWDYKPHRYRPKGNYPAEALLGVELEVGGGQGDIADAVSAFDDAESHLYMKQDGSIAGVEIVTHPMTLTWARGFDFTGLLGELVAAGCYVNDGYGLHVHVSRNAFSRHGGEQSSAHQMRWLLFIYRNVPDVEQLARRTASRWAEFKKPQPGELARKAKGPLPESRYVAVNCNNERTFELRFFSSTLNPVQFWAALEFADASVRYTAGHTTREMLCDGALTWRHFTEWVARNNYPNLTAELAR